MAETKKSTPAPSGVPKPTKKKQAVNSQELAGAFLPQLGAGLLGNPAAGMPQAPVSGSNMAGVFDAFGQNVAAQAALAPRQQSLREGATFGRHLGMGGYEGGNSAGAGGDPFTNGFFKDPAQRAGLQSLPMQRTAAQVGSPVQAEPFVLPGDSAQTPYGPISRHFNGGEPNVPDYRAQAAMPPPPPAAMDPLMSSVSQGAATGAATGAIDSAQMAQAFAPAPAMPETYDTAGSAGGSFAAPQWQTADGQRYELPAGPLPPSRLQSAMNAMRMAPPLPFR